MSNRPNFSPTLWGRLSLIALSVVVLAATTAPAVQNRGGGQQARPDDRRVRGVLGGLEMTAADTAVTLGILSSTRGTRWRTAAP